MTKLTKEIKEWGLKFCLTIHRAPNMIDIAARLGIIFPKKNFEIDVHSDEYQKVYDIWYPLQDYLDKKIRKEWERVSCELNDDIIYAYLAGQRRGRF